MSIISITGGQWGDEGKGKIVDHLSANVDIVARYQGGANAGHTVYVKDRKIILHQVPSGILRDDCHCILGNGMVIDPVSLVEEINMLRQNGISVEGRIHIANTAHIVTPVHRAIDRASETNTAQKIGTTSRGIGPTYVDKYNRRGIRGHNLTDSDKLEEMVKKRLEDAITHGELYDLSAEDIEHEFPKFLECAKSISPMVTDTFKFMQGKLEVGANILIEGAQGTLLDIDHGTYPFVTSSNCSVGGIANGLGIPITAIDRRIGIFKAYTTRVGEGPFPTELFDETGSQLQETGGEFGATTGRPRRCGWFDGTLAGYSSRINGFTEIALTKLDVLDELDEIKICTAYEVDGQRTKHFSEVLHRLAEVTPIYESIPGWCEPTTDIEHFDELPARAERFIRILSDIMETPIKFVSTGPEREQLISR
ncbi:MAG: adenylosuccinate synthase [FCB group bacterium]|nr:adenylosuccinate synthase [FCB group bacterium]